MDQIVKLERDDDVYHLRSLIQWNQTRRVIVEAPRSAHALKQEFAQRLLQRWAEEANVQVAIVSEDFETSKIAKQLGIPVFGSLKRAQNSNFRLQLPDSELVGDEKHMLWDSPPAWTVERILGVTWLQVIVTAFLFFIAFGILGIAAYWLVPSATVRITPAAQALFNTSDITLDPSATGTDVENATIIARVLTREISGTATLATTKTQNAPATRATGQVVFTNLAGVETPIPRGTIVETSAGVTVRFSTMATATLPASYGSRVTVPVQAVDLGPVGNVGALQINLIEGSVAGAARVINPAPTGGGAVKPVRVVTRDDKANLESQLGAQLQKIAAAALKDEAATASQDINSEFYLVPDSIKVQTTDALYDHLVDDPADNLSLRMTADATGIVVSRQRLLDFATSVLRSEIAPGYTMLPNSTQIDIDPSSNVVNGRYVIRLRSVAYQVPQLDQGVIVSGLKGLSLADANDYLLRAATLGQAPEVHVTPTWWKQMPLLGFRIALFVDMPTSGTDRSSP